MFVCCLLFDVFVWSMLLGVLFVVACCSLMVVVCCLSIGVRCALSIVRRVMWFVACSWLRFVRCWLFFVPCLSLFVGCSF